MANLTAGEAPLAEALQSSYLPDGLYFHPHWQKYQSEFEAIPDWAHWGVGLYMAFVCFTATIGNLIVIYIFTATRQLRTPSNVFVVNLAISDLAFSCVNGFPLMTISCFNRVWIFGPLACQIYSAIGAISGMNSIASLACISYDRYSVISNPLEAMRTSSKKKSFFKCIICWAWSSIWAVGPLVGWGQYIPEAMMTSCSFDYLSTDYNTFSFCMCIFCFGFCLPTAGVIYCYINIVGSVVGAAKEMAKTAERMGAAGGQQDDKARKQELALTKVAFGTVTLFMCSWLPYAAIVQCGVWGYYEYVTPYTSVLPIMTCKASAMWNPIIYSLSHPKFRAQLEARFPWLLCCAGSNIDRSDGKSEMSMSASGASQMSTISESEGPARA